MDTMKDSQKVRWKVHWRGSSTEPLRGSLMESLKEFCWVSEMAVQMVEVMEQQMVHGMVLRMAVVKAQH